jgi:hypothetical protein
MPAQLDTEIQVQSAGKGRHGPSIYGLLIGVQKLGAVLVFANAVPIYRRMAGDFAGHKPEPGLLWWALAAVLLIQGGYWARIRLSPALPRWGNVVLGHLVHFGARLSFVFASSAFALMFFVRFDNRSMPPRRIAMVLLLLFSMLCYMLELERLAKALRGTEVNS